MVLTKRYLKKMLNSMWTTIPESLERELLSKFGQTCEDDTGQIHDFTEQDIYENVRKEVQKHDSNNKNWCYLQS